MRRGVFLLCVFSVGCFEFGCIQLLGNALCQNDVLCVEWNSKRYLLYSCLACTVITVVVGTGAGEEDQDAYDINKLKKPVNGNIPGLDGKTLSEADTLLVRGKFRLFVAVGCRITLCQPSVGIAQ